MGFIRTTKSIYSGIQLTKNTILVNGKKNNRKYPVSLKNNNIIAQADTIEELCDEFVIVIDGKHYITNEFEANCIIWGSKTQNLYGAIWTDKGLIYVAKLNENGKLELI